jgi:hypothetical protein
MNWAHVQWFLSKSDGTEDIGMDSEEFMTLKNRIFQINQRQTNAVPLLPGMPPSEFHTCIIHSQALEI